MKTTSLQQAAENWRWRFLGRGGGVCLVGWFSVISFECTSTGCFAYIDAVQIFNKGKSKAGRANGDVLFIDGSLENNEAKNQNLLTVERYAYRATLQASANNDSNRNIPASVIPSRRRPRTTSTPFVPR